MGDISDEDAAQPLVSGRKIQVKGSMQFREETDNQDIVFVVEAPNLARVSGKPVYPCRPKLVYAEGYSYVYVRACARDHVCMYVCM